MPAVLSDGLRTLGEVFIPPKASLIMVKNGFMKGITAARANQDDYLDADSQRGSM